MKESKFEKEEVKKREERETEVWPARREGAKLILGIREWTGKNSRDEYIKTMLEINEIEQAIKGSATQPYDSEYAESVEKVKLIGDFLDAQRELLVSAGKMKDMSHEERRDYLDYAMMTKEEESELASKENLEKFIKRFELE